MHELQERGLQMLQWIEGEWQSHELQQMEWQVMELWVDGMHALDQ
jgi:hypothetical protein